MWLVVLLYRIITPSKRHPRLSMIQKGTRHMGESGTSGAHSAGARGMVYRTRGFAVKARESDSNLQHPQKSYDWPCNFSIEGKRQADPRSLMAGWSSQW